MHTATIRTLKYDSSSESESTDSTDFPPRRMLMTFKI